MLRLGRHLRKGWVAESARLTSHLTVSLESVVSTLATDLARTNVREGALEKEAYEASRQTLLAKHNLAGKKGFRELIQYWVDKDFEQNQAVEAAQWERR